MANQQWLLIGAILVSFVYHQFTVWKIVWRAFINTKVLTDYLKGCKVTVPAVNWRGKAIRRSTRSLERMAIIESPMVGYQNAEKSYRSESEGISSSSKGTRQRQTKALTLKTGNEVWFVSKIRMTGD